MSSSHLLRNIVRRFRTSTQDAGFDPIESTRRMIDLSDEIAALNRRILERSKSGSPEDVADRERLAMLTEELRSKPAVVQGSNQTA